MKTHHLIAALAIVAFAGVMSSCSSSESYVKYIPDDADIVAGADLKSIISGSRISENTSAIRAVESYLEDYEDEEVVECVKGMLENPDKMTGVDLNSTAYAYGMLGDETLGQINVLFGISDRDILMKNISTLYYGDIEFSPSGDFYCYSDYESVIILYKDFGIIHYEPDGYYENDDPIDPGKILKSMQTDKDISSVPAFRKASSSGSDVWAFVNAEEVMDVIAGGEYEALAKELGLGVELPDFADSYAYVNVDFAKAEAKVKVGMEFPSAERRKLEEQYSYAGKISGKQLKFAPEDAMAVAVMNLDFKKLLDDTGLSTELSIPSIVSDILSAINGETLLSLNDLKLDRYGDLKSVDAVVAAPVSNDDFLEQANRLIGGEKSGSGTYSVSVDDGLDLYYGVDGKMLYVSTSSEDTDGIKKKSSNFYGKYGSEVSGGYSYVGINVPALTELLEDEIDAETAMVLSVVDFVQITQPSLFEGEVTVRFSGNKNPLETAVSMVQDYLNLVF